MLYDRRRNSIVIARLHGVAGRLPAAKQPIDHGPRAAPLVAIDHHTRGIADRDRHGTLRAPAFKMCVSMAEDDAL